MKYDLLHIQGKPYILVPLHDYRKMTSGSNDAQLPDSVLDEISARQAHPIKIVRKYRGMTQADLAKKSGISRPYLTEIETGKKDGSLRAMKSIADALDVGIGDLA
ncbi:MAG: helix-turn-helix transcriptional regulator [Alphaproteobacteria bacterium]|nr:helix-turn-helix transcriptional regulator [Alphaproteobacteria bacterium]